MNTAASRRRRGITFIETLVLIAIAVIFVSLLLPSSDERMRREIQRRIDNWQPRPEDVPSAKPQSLCPEMDITGAWRAKQGRGGTSLTLWDNAKGEYLVEFSTGGCMGRYMTTRRASFADGLLSLDQAVSEYPGRTYDRLYAVERDDAAYLVPAPSVAAFEAGDQRSWPFRRPEKPDAAEAAD
jgi:hypothetical protein